MGITWTPDQVTWVKAPAKALHCVLGHSASRHPVIKWVLQQISGQGVALSSDENPIWGGGGWVEIPLVTSIAKETGDETGLIGHLACMQM